MKLFLIRHTKVDLAKGICYGQSDIKLADNFEEEASKIKERNRSHQFSAIYSSPLQRCALLAQTLGENDKNIIYDDRLKELNFGKWEGKSWNAIQDTTEAKHWFNDYINTPCPNGESYRDLLERVSSFINELKQLPNDETICIITHGGVILAFLSTINDISPLKTFEIKIDYGQVIQIYLQNNDNV